MDLWQKLEREKKAILLYGMGDGAEKILDALEMRGIRAAGVFASDGFVRDKTFRGFRLMSFSEAKEAFGDFVVLLAFGTSRPEVLENISRVAKERRLYVPDVPVAGGKLFDCELAAENKEKIKAVYEALSTEADRYDYESVIRYKLTGWPSYLRRSERDKSAAYVLLSVNGGVCLDCGAFTGDTVAELLSFCPNVEKVYAIEPDGASFKKLQRYAAGDGRIIPVNAAVGRAAGEVRFSAAGNRGSRAEGDGESVAVSCISIDGLLGGERADFIKLDVEGKEIDAIDGATETIRRFKPKMLVSCYHRSEDMFELPLKILKIRSDYKLHFCHPRYLPAWDCAFLFV